MTNPYYIKPIRYYTPQKLDDFQRQMPNSGAFSAGGSFQQESPSPSQQNSYINYGELAQGALQLGTQVAGDLNAHRSIQTNAPSQQVDQFGQPVYNLGGFASQTNSINPRQMVGSVGGDVASGALQGAAAGSTLGPVGAAVGGLIGGIGGAVGNIFGRRKANRKQQRAERNLRFAQETFNDRNIDYQQGLLARQAYQDQLSRNNPYGIPNSYY